MGATGRKFVFGGMKHCGKSTHGRRLAAFLHGDFIDTDEQLEACYRRENGEALSSREIFRKHGEEFFRRLEARVIGELAGLTMERDRVVALGGGVPANRFVNPAALKALGCFIYLEIDGDTAYRRVVEGGLPPFLAESADPAAKFMEMYRERAEFYRRCAAVTLPVAGDEPVEAVGAKLIAELQRLNLL